MWCSSRWCSSARRRRSSSTSTRHRWVRCSARAAAAAAWSRWTSSRPTPPRPASPTPARLLAPSWTWPKWCGVASRYSAPSPKAPSNWCVFPGRASAANLAPHAPLRRVHWQLQKCRLRHDHHLQNDSRSALTRWTQMPLLRMSFQSGSHSHWHH